MAGPRKKKSSAPASRASQKGRGRFRIELVFNTSVRITLAGVILQREAAIVQKCFDAVLSTPLEGKLILDLAAVPVISQRGIKALLRLRNKSKKQGRELEVHGLEPAVRLALEEQGLGKAFVLK